MVVVTNILSIVRSHVSCYQFVSVKKFIEKPVKKQPWKISFSMCENFWLRYQKFLLTICGEGLCLQDKAYDSWKITHFSYTSMFVCLKKVFSFYPRQIVVGKLHSQGCYVLYRYECQFSKSKCHISLSALKRFRNCFLFLKECWLQTILTRIASYSENRDICPMVLYWMHKLFIRIEFLTPPRWESDCFDTLEKKFLSWLTVMHRQNRELY